jgi:hypothetical protein
MASDILGFQPYGRLKTLRFYQNAYQNQLANAPLTKKERKHIELCLAEVKRELKELNAALRAIKKKQVEE